MANRPIPEPTATPAYSTVRVLCPTTGKLLRVISHAELQARGEVVPEQHPPVFQPREEEYPASRPRPQRPLRPRA